MEHFTPIPSLIGGLLVGLASALMLVLNGRIAGISGIVGGLLSPSPGETRWRGAFTLGMLAGGVAFYLVRPQAFAYALDRSYAALAVAGLLVGFGTRLGAGCTSGHGICGISRLSPRSLVATATFMATGIATVYVTNTFFGGAL